MFSNPAHIVAWTDMYSIVAWIVYPYSSWIGLTILKKKLVKAWSYKNDTLIIYIYIK